MGNDDKAWLSMDEQLWVSDHGYGWRGDSTQAVFSAIFFHFVSFLTFCSKSSLLLKSRREEI